MDKIPEIGSRRAHISAGCHAIGMKPCAAMTACTAAGPAIKCTNTDGLGLQGLDGVHALRWNDFWRIAILTAMTFMAFTGFM
jgi:hypothetical protein